MALGQSDFEAITLAVRTSGQSAVADLQAHLGRVNGELNNYKAALAAGVIPATEFTEKVKGLIAAQKDLEASVRAATRVLNGQSASMEFSAQAASRAILEVSRGLEDLATGGVIGVLNNIPGTVQAVGQAAGLSAASVATLTGGISLLATAAFELYKNWDQLENAFGIGVPRPVLDSTEELKNKLKEAEKITADLGKQTTFTLTELHQYKDATAKVKELNAELERRKDLESILSGKSKAESARASAFKEAVAETGGTEAVRSLEGAIDPHAVGGKIFNQVRGKDSTPRELAQDMIREAGGGDKRIRDQIVELLNSAYKPTKGSFAANITATSPETIAAKKAAEDAALEQQKINDRLKAEAKHQADTDPNITGKSRDKDLNAQIGLAEDHVREKTRDFQDAKRKAEGEAVWQIGQQQRLDREGKTAAGRAQTAQQKAVNKVAPAFENPLQMAINQNRWAQAQGDPSAVPEKALARNLQSTVARNLHASGQNPALAGGVVGKAFQGADEKYANMFARTGDREQSLIGVNHELMAALAREVQAGSRRDMQIQQLMNNAQNLGQQQQRMRESRKTLSLTPGS